MTRGVASTSWGGLAGYVFAGAVSVLDDSVTLLSVLDYDVALCLDAQAREIWVTRAELDAIVADLRVVKKSAIAFVAIGNAVMSVEVQVTAAEKAVSRSRAAIEKLRGATDTHAGKMTQVSQSVVGIEERLGAVAVPLRPQFDGTVVVSEAVLGSTAAVLRGCSTTLAAEWGMGSSTLEEVRLTDGTVITEAFNLSLEKFEAAYGQALFAIWHEVEHYADILTRAAGMYEEYDTAAARILNRVDSGV